MLIRDKVELLFFFNVDFLEFVVCVQFYSVTSQEIEMDQTTLFPVLFLFVLLFSFRHERGI
jgi:hypothetical protein